MFMTFCTVYLMVLMAELCPLACVAGGWSAGCAMAKGSPLEAYGAWCAADLAVQGGATVLGALAEALKE